MRVSEAMQGDFRHAEICGNQPPSARYVARRLRAVLEIGEHERIGGWLPGTEGHAELELLTPVIAQRVDHDLVQADVTPPGLRFRGLETEPVRLVSSSASRTRISLASRATFNQRKARISPSLMPVNSAKIAVGYIRWPRRSEMSLAIPSGSRIAISPTLDLGRRLQLGDVARHYAVPNGIVEGVRERSMCVNHGARRHATTPLAATAGRSVACQVSTSSVVSF